VAGTLLKRCNCFTAKNSESIGIFVPHWWDVRFDLCSLCSGFLVAWVDAFEEITDQPRRFGSAMSGVSDKTAKECDFPLIFY